MSFLEMYMQEFVTYMILGWFWFEDLSHPSIHILCVIYLRLPYDYHVICVINV